MRKIFKYLFLPGVVIVFYSTACFSQGGAVEFTDSMGLNAYLVENAGPVSIAYDSAYVLNKKIFGVYNDSYNKAKNCNAASKVLIEHYEGIISLQDSMLNSKERYYQQLKLNFDSLANNTNSFVNKTNNNVSVIQQSVTNAESNLNSIKSHIDSSLDKLKLENRQRLKLAVGGFTIGVGITALIFLVAK